MNIEFFLFLPDFLIRRKSHVQISPPDENRVPHRKSWGDAKSNFAESLVNPTARFHETSAIIKVLPEVAVVFAGCSCTDTRTHKQKGSPTQYKFFLPSVLQTQLRPATATSGSTFRFICPVVLSASHES